MSKKENLRPGPSGRPRPADESPTLPPRPPGPAGVAFLSVGPDEPVEHLFRRLLGAYLAGAAEFVVRESPVLSPSAREVVRTFCRRTRQPEVVSEEPDGLRLRDLSFESPVFLDQRVERMGRIVLAFHREAVDGWFDLPFGDDSYWARKDDDVDREAWYIQRLATLRLGVRGGAGELLGSFIVARSLERIADHAIVLGTVGPRLAALPQGAGAATSLRQFHAQAMDHLTGALAASDGDRANELLDTGDALAASGQALADRLLPGVGGGTMPPATAAAVARILESIGRTIAYAQDIAQVALDRSVPVPGPTERGRSTGPLSAVPRRERFVPVPAH
jgi:hypothetical protein